MPGVLSATFIALWLATSHEVKPGETLWGLGVKYGCSVGELRNANGLDEASALRIGTSLQIPGTCKRAPHGPGGVTHKVKPGDTLTRIARRYGTTPAQLRVQNGLKDDVIVVGQALLVRPAKRLPLRLVRGQSIGRPHRGKLVDGAQLPRDLGYYRRRPQWAYGAQHAIDHTRRAIARVRAEFPGVHRLAIGDLSRRRGGRIPGHRSHQSGRDIDLGLYFHRTPSGYPKEFVQADRGRLHAAATWALVHALFLASQQPGGPERVFLDYTVQGELYRHARAQGVSRSTLRRVFQYPNGRSARGRLVSHEPKHADHLHVRFRCLPKDRNCR